MNFPSGMSVIYTNNSVTVRFSDGAIPKTVTSGQPNYVRVMNLLKDWNLGAYDESVEDQWVTKLKEAFDPKLAVESYLTERAADAVQYKDGRVTYNGIEVHNAVVTRIIAAAKDDLPIDNLLNFLNNLQENPSYRSVEQLYGFLEKHLLPITPEGNFRAYKVINGNYTDCHTGTIDNSIGTFVSMPRNKVEDDPNKTCSAGLHVCASEYARGFFMSSGRRLMEVEVNPRDVVSIPTDYNNAKMRVCQYQVIAEMEENSTALDNRLYTDHDSYVPPVDSEYEGGGDNYDASWVISSREENDYLDDYEETEGFDPVFRA